jgi:hypothetical protein
MAWYDFFLGTPERFEQRSTLSPQQTSLQDQLFRALQGQNAGGTFGNLADYYRGLLGGEGFDEFAAPEMRRYREEILPGLAEQFAGMGAGGSGLSSSGFGNAATRGATDLSERLAAMRANIRQQGAAGLGSLTSQGLTPYSQNYFVPQQPGLVQYGAQGLGSGIGAFAGPALGSAGANWAKSLFGDKKASPQMSPTGTLT